MTNTIAFCLALVIAGAVALDLWFDTGAVMFLGRKFVALVDYTAFWR